MTITGEGTQALSDMHWKKRENKFLGANSITERENKEIKHLDKKNKTDQFISKFPENEKFLGFENVSAFLWLIPARTQTFATPTLQSKFFTTASLSATTFLPGGPATPKSFILSMNFKTFSSQCPPPKGTEA